MDAFEQFAEDYKQEILSVCPSTVKLEEKGGITVVTPLTDSTLWTQISRADELTLDKNGKELGIVGFVRLVSAANNFYAENVEAYRELLEGFANKSHHQIFTTRTDCPIGTFHIGLQSFTVVFETSVLVHKESRMNNFFDFLNASIDLVEFANSKLTRKS